VGGLAVGCDEVRVFVGGALVAVAVEVNVDVAVRLAVSVGDGVSVAVLVSVAVAVNTTGVFVETGLALAAEMLVAIT